MRWSASGSSFGCEVVKAARSRSRVSRSQIGRGCVAGAQRGQDCDDRQGLDPLLPEVAQAQAAQALGELAAGDVLHEGQVGKGRCGAVQRLRQGELEAGVGEVVLAADDVADAEVEVVDDRREEVGGGAVLAADDGVAEGRELDLDGAADQVGEGDRAVRQEEAPVRRPVGVPGTGCQGGTVVAGRLAAGELGPAPGLQLLRGLVAGVDGTTGPEPLERSLVEGGALALPVLLVPTHAEPGQILADRPLKVGARALAVGVVEAEDEAARLLAGEEPVDHGRARVAQMEQPGRARGETDGWRHGVAHMAQLRGCIKGRAG